MTKRRTKGDGGLTQRHDAPSCPPLVDGVRPPHACKGRWQGTIDVVIDGRKRRKYIYAPTQRAARLKLAEAVRAKESGTLIIGTTTVEAWLVYWLDNIAARRVKPQTLRGYRSKTRTYLVPHLGRHRLTALRPEHIRSLHDWMRDQGLAEATVRQAHAVLDRALHDAVNDGKLATSPADRVDAPKTTRNRRQGLTLDEARTVLRHSGDDARWWLALFYGMRQGECLGLRWQDVDFDRHALTVAQTLQTAEDGSLFFDRPKSEASARTLPLLPQVEARLRLLWENSSEQARWGLIFHRPDGNPIRPRDDWQAWRDLLDAATQPPLAPLPQIALHAARNSAASLMEAGGIPERLVMQILGHSQVQMTHNYQTAEIERMREAFGPVSRLLELD